MAHQDDRPAPKRRWSFRREGLKLFVAFSVVLHLVFAFGWVFSHYVEKAAEARKEEAALQLLEKRREAEKQAKAEIRKQTHELTKQEVAAELKKDFERLIQKDLPQEKARNLWDELLAGLDSQIEQYTGELSDAGASDADLRNLMASLKRDMVNQLHEKVRGMTGRQLAENFLAKVSDQVVPKIAEIYRKEIERRVGEPLQREGARIVKDEQTLVARERLAIQGALDGALREAEKARRELAGAQERLGKAAADGVQSGKAGAQLLANAAKGEERYADQANALLQSAGAAVEKAAAALGEGAAKEKTAQSKGAGDSAHSEIGAAKAAAQQGDATGTGTHAAAAAGAARKMGAAIGEAKAALEQSGADAKTQSAVRAGLEQAQRQADAAAEALKGVQGRLDKARDAASKADQAGGQQLANAAKREAAAAERAETALKSAEDQLRKAAERAASMGDELEKKIAGAADQEARTAQKHARAVKDAAADGKAGDAAQEAGGAAGAAQKLSAAVSAAKADAEKAEFDPAAMARAVLKDITDQEIKGVMNDAFRKGFEGNALPRLSGKLTQSFQGQLGDAGIDDGALVRQVGEKVREMLKDQVPDQTDAGEASTEALEQGQGLGGAQSSGKRKGSRAKAIGDRASKAAHALAEGEMSGVGGDSKGDDQALQLAGGKGGAAGGGDGEGAQGLLNRVANMAANANAGRMGMLEGGGSGGDGIAKMRQGALARSQDAARALGSRFHYDEKEHTQLTDGIRERDRKAARGEAWERKATVGEVWAVEQAEETPRPAALLMPPEPKGEVVGEAQKKDPYKPAFKTIKFAAMPYVREPIKLDGDLSEWKEIPGQPMHATWDGPKRPDLKVSDSHHVKMAWDNTGFYFAYNVVDPDNDIKRVKPAVFWDGDGVEIFVDAHNVKNRKRGAAGTQQFWVWPFGMSGDPTKTGGEAVLENANTPWQWVVFTSAELQRAAKKVEGGWTLEVHLPAERINDLDLQPGRILGFNFSICTGTVLCYYWGGASDVRTSEHPDTWGDILLAGSDGKLELPEKLTAEIKAGAAAKPARGQLIGAALKIRVTDPDMNLSQERKDKLSVAVTAGSGDREIAILEESGAKTGIFEGALRTGLALGEPVSGTLSLYEGEKVLVTYIDQARSDGTRNVEVKLSIKTCASAVTMAGGQ